MKLVHYYNPETLIYLGSGDIHKDPVYDDYIKPSNASFTKLPEYNKETEQLKYQPDSDIFLVEPKQVEVTAYHKQTKQPKQFDDKSLVTVEYTILKPLANSEWNSSEWEKKIELARNAKHDEIIAWRGAEEAKPKQFVTIDSIKWDSDPAARLRIESTLASDFIPPYWTDANNVDQPITRESLKAIHTEIIKKGFDIHSRQRKMKKEIEELTPVDAVEKYQVGWPLKPT